MERDKPGEKPLVADHHHATRTFTTGSSDSLPRNIYRWSALLLLVVIALVGFTRSREAAAEAKSTDSILDNAERMLSEGRTTFRFETFSDEAFWGDTIKLHQSLAGSKLGGVGPGVSPKTTTVSGGLGSMKKRRSIADWAVPHGAPGRIVLPSEGRIFLPSQPVTGGRNNGEQQPLAAKSYRLALKPLDAP